MCASLTAQNSVPVSLKSATPQSQSSISSNSHSAGSSSLGTITPSATKETPAKKPVENTTNGGNSKPISVEPIKKLSDYTIDELFTDRSLSPSRKPMGRFSPDGKHLLSVNTQKDPAGDYWTVIQTPIVLPPSPIDPQKTKIPQPKANNRLPKKSLQIIKIPGQIHRQIHKHLTQNPTTP